MIWKQREKWVERERWHESTKWNWKKKFKLQTRTDKIPLGFITKTARGGNGRKPFSVLSKNPPPIEPYNFLH